MFRTNDAKKEHHLLMPAILGLKAVWLFETILLMIIKHPLESKENRRLERPNKTRGSGQLPSLDRKSGLFKPPRRQSVVELNPPSQYEILL
jgi:hypothetical protein